MRNVDPALESARLAWDEGRLRLDEDTPVRDERRRVAGAVGDELRRRVGLTFTQRELLEAYDAAAGWYLELAQRVAPDSPEAWDPVALDGAFGLAARRSGEG